jgi:hypothetical protein
VPKNLAPMRAALNLRLAWRGRRFRRKSVLAAFARQNSQSIAPTAVR